MRTARPAALGLSCLLAAAALSCGADDRAASARPGPSTQAPSTTTALAAAPERDPAALVEPAGVEFPPDLEGLEYVSVHDPGDNPEYQGLDWTTWLVFVEEHEGRPRVAGLAQYAWTP